MLKERFSCKLDGLTILLVASGSLIAVSQQPDHIPENENEDVEDFVFAKLTNNVTCCFYLTLGLLFVSREIMMQKI